MKELMFERSIKHDPVEHFDARDSHIRQPKCEVTARGVDNSAIECRGKLGTSVTALPTKDGNNSRTFWIIFVVGQAGLTAIAREDLAKAQIDAAQQFEANYGILIQIVIMFAVVAGPEPLFTCLRPRPVILAGTAECVIDVLVGESLKITEPQVRHAPSRQPEDNPPFPLRARTKGNTTVWGARRHIGATLN
ncbi:hypothetical protein E4U58_004987 [Claviceps cyperi]|nr:hypothetical protein E4U58_004987 [Claviceps cyperi]